MSNTARFHYNRWSLYILEWYSGFKLGHSKNYNYDLSNIKQRVTGHLYKLFVTGRLSLSTRKDLSTYMGGEALALQHYECYEEAEKKYKELLQWDKISQTFYSTWDAVLHNKPISSAKFAAQIPGA